ncbi:MAG: hypothetical protein ACK40N_13025 [Meiothermus ruber]|jgi:hypothetical protein|uniref:Uncharacterized protein n=2 Tax=Meiothermus hypogaeus TaxID=884155 RepID=A0A511QWZ7_9DEIN|nr:MULTISPECIES: hypothetical protein [Meiothermus]GIW30189.1 MAG: hypothetical protein KatS3mg071_0363 [Meiothermus sp.]MCL6531302.1 hypothetical protein [Meiothermus ruber]MCX7803366.1 hypothetical protein [Meiothermus ruber]RIH78973.1 hypothetical protein Mhypo_01336 [Meiothermus hypogaeus]GEM81913.1 hypothetical protein MHY01S_00790 [Meiothermus hypogaeus NBRC 106114]
MSALDRAYQRCQTPAQARHYARICEKNRNWPAAQLYHEVAEALEAAERLRAAIHPACPICGGRGMLDDIECWLCSPPARF